MVNQNKILTVSYGTFSCTLEGFENPFNTMKAIAEYFRDLAAEDRYFGAEPPQPDAGMLKLIAEREMQRRIDAKISENSVVLRASEPAEPDSIAADTPSAPNAKAPNLDAVQTAPRTQDPVPVVHIPAVQPAPLAPRPEPALAAAPSRESVAAKLARIRAAVEKSRPDPVAQNETASDWPALADGGADQTEWLEDTQLSAAGSDDIGVGSVISARAETIVDDDNGFDLGAASEGSFDSEAEVASNSPPMMFEPDADQAIDDGFDDDFDLGALSARLAEPSAPAPERDLAPIAAQDPDVPDDAFEPEDAPKVADMEMVEPRAADAPAMAPDAATAAAVVQPDPAPEPRRQRIIRVRRAQAAQVPPAALLSPDAEAELARELELAIQDAPIAASAPIADSLDDDATLDAVLQGLNAGPDADASDTAPATAQVDEKEFEDLDLLQDAEPDTAPAAQQPLESPDDADLFQTEPSIFDDPPAAAAPPREDSRPRRVAPEMPPRPVRPSRPEGLARARTTERPAAPIAAPVRPRRAALQLTPDDAAESDRLLRQTNDALQGPENRRRIATIAHLKAAVAATVADRLSKGDMDTQTPQDPSDAFRADLVQAVRPRRPTAVPAAAPVSPSRPTIAARASQVPPLVLVSEQRVPKPAAQVTYDSADDDEDTDDAPNIFAASSEFSEFGKRVGAVTPGEWMEAAAAHLMLKDGFDTFTRPQLVGRLLGHPPMAAALDREAQLVLFGALLREGRLVKPKRGQFTLPDSSPFLAQARRMAG